MPYTTDNRWAAGGSGANQPPEAIAAYAGRWIDYGRMADIPGDRSGFAFIELADAELLCAELKKHGAFTIRPHDLQREVTVVQTVSPTVTVAYRRAGGYVYCDAWLVPTA